MDFLKTEEKKKFPSAGVLIKQWVSVVFTKSTAAAAAGAVEGKNRKKKRGKKVAPEGCFWVCVGAEKQRFVMKTEHANHPLFRKLLEDAESEYGFDDIDGPIKLPCDVNLFYKVLAEMEISSEEEEEEGGFVCGSCSPFTPTRSRSRPCFRNKVYEYGLLSPSRLLKMNHF